jgi:hypothetical protein
MGRSKGSQLKGWIESPNALRWRLGQLSGCAFTETESSQIIIGKLGPRLPPRLAHQRNPHVAALSDKAGAKIKDTIHATYPGRMKTPLGTQVTDNWLLPKEGLGGRGNVRRALWY